MCLRLPIFADLTDEQQRAFMLVSDESILISGPPGSGKSVIALFRAANVQKLGDDRNPIVLTASRLLTMWNRRAMDLACEQLEADPSRVEVKTVDAWFAGSPRNPRSGWFFRTFGEPCPRQRPTGRSTYWPIDWDAALGKANQEITVRPTLDLIVDEAQDLGEQFWYIVLPHCRTCTVFCDTNQSQKEPPDGRQITDDDVANMLGIPKEEAGERRQRLTMNFRNTGRVAGIANALHPPVGGEVRALPRATEPGPHPVLRRTRDIRETVEHIATVANNHPQLSHAVLTQSLKVSRQVMQALEEISQRPEFGRLEFQEFSSDNREVDPCASGLMITWYRNARGLEFDYVYLVGLQDWPRLDETVNRNQMYVCVTRTRSQLELMWHGDGEPAVLQDLPRDLFKEL